MTGEEGLFGNRFYPSVNDEVNVCKHRNLVDSKAKPWMEKQDPYLFQFEMMLLQLANSDNCPYRMSELEAMCLETLLEVKDRINYLDAAKAAYQLDADLHYNKK